MLRFKSSKIIDKNSYCGYNKNAISKIDYILISIGGLIDMKKIISLALVLVMALVCLTGCTKLAAPVGTYADGTETSILEFGAYDEENNVCPLTISNTISGLTITGTCTILENDPDLPSYIVVFTADSGETWEYVYDASIDVVQDLIENSYICYYGANYVDAAEVPAE